ncbi:MAG: hypothetical protein AAFY34_12350 [Pseudomonadota bacterium]
MAMTGTHGNTLDWLNEQIVELDRWRADMTDGVKDESLHMIDRLDAHRNWLIGAIADLKDFGERAD